VVAVDRGGVVVELRWRLGGEANVRYQALKMRDGRIVDMQDYLDATAARRAVR
jgi:ketosteroid isomerase-like protein